MVLPSAIAQNVTGTLPSSGYTVFPGVDVPRDTYNMAPVSNTCSKNGSAPYITQVNGCASRMETCCLDQRDFDSNQLVGDHLAEANCEGNCKLAVLLTISDCMRPSTPADAVLSHA